MLLVLTLQIKIILFMEKLKIHPSAIKIISEYQCYPIWLYDINEIDRICNSMAIFEYKDELQKRLPNIKTEWLPISMSLIDQINNWDSIYQKSFINTSYEFSFMFESKEQELFFFNKKREIIEKLKKELPCMNIYE